MTRRFPATTLAFVLALAACGGAQKRAEEYAVPGQTEMIVDSLQIAGVKAFAVDELKEGLRTRPNPGWVARTLGAKKAYFNTIDWRQDLERIRTFYQARGYFDAKIVSQRVSEDPAEKTVSLAIRVSEGAPTLISGVYVDGLQATSVATANILAGLPVRKGDVFEERNYLRAKEALLRKLRAASYAHAQVRGRVVVEPGKLAADVKFFVDPGPLSRFGAVEIAGLEQVPQERVRDALTIEEGSAYDPAELLRTQERIYDLGVFSVVKVAPNFDVAETVDETEDEDEGLSSLLDQAMETAEERTQLNPVIPVAIRLKEAKLWNVRVGAGIAADSARQDVHGRLDWSSRNFLGGLRKLQQFNSIGYAWAPTFLTADDLGNAGVIVDSELRFTQPQFIERFTTFESRIRFEREVEPGFTLTSPTARLAVRRKFFDFMTAELSYDFALYLLSDLDESLLGSSLRLQPEYLLEYLQQAILFDFTDDFLDPREGVKVEARVLEATNYVGQLPGIPTGGSFDFVTPQLSVEAYTPFQFGTAWVLAGRARLGTIWIVGRGKEPPIPNRLYAGGLGSMRAFGYQRMGLYSREGDPIPIGGQTRFEAAFEPRMRLIRDAAEVGDVWLAPFVDAASILPGGLFIAPPGGGEHEALTDVFDTLLWGTGAGIWWNTPIGPIRLDVAYRISDIAQDERFRRCTVPEDASGTCTAGFLPTNEDPIQQSISRWNVLLGIGHSF